MSKIDGQVRVEELLEQATWLRQLARRLVADAAEADDVVQEAWRVALEAETSGVRSPRAWLATISRNLVIRREHGRRRRQASEKVAASRIAASSDDATCERLDWQRRLHQAIAELPAPMRDIIVLRYLDELPPRRIAELHGLSGDVVRKRLERALKLLRDRLGRERPDGFRDIALGLIPSRSRGRRAPRDDRPGSVDSSRESYSCR